MRQLALALFVASAVTSAMNAAFAAPFRPELRREPTADLQRVPPEPQIPRAPSLLDDGIAGAATRSGRVWTGHPRVLVLLVDFLDRPADPVLHDPAHYEQLYFSEHEVETGSLRDWYREVSYGRVAVTGEVHGWFRMPLLYEEYANGQSGLCPTCFPLNARGLAAHAVTAAVDAGVDFTQFDNDGPDGVPGSGDDDHILDGLMVVFAGYGAERTGHADDIRSHYWNMTAMEQVGDISVPDYLAVPEIENVGVAVHEFGHLLGAEDLYDLSGRGNGLGDYSVMAYGMWFDNGTSPGGPDPYTMILWGFLDPENPGADEPTIRIPSIRVEPYALRLWTLGQEGPEYFLVENRRGEGVDRYIEDGLVVYHVDERQLAQNNPTTYRVAVVQADGLRSLEDGTSRGDSGDFFPGKWDVRELTDDTDPGTRANSGDPSMVALRGIGDPGPEVTVGVEVGRFIAGGPKPRLDVVPSRGYFAGGVDPDGLGLVRLVIENRGTRLDAGRFRLFSRDPRVGLRGDLDVYLASIAALEDRDLQGSVEVELEGVPASSRATIPLEAEWVASGTTYSMAAALPLVGTVARREGFETDVPDVQHHVLNDGGDSWKREITRASEGLWAWGTRGYGPREDQVLQIGPIALAGVSELRFKQFMNAQAFGDYASDGGFLEVSNDGGASWNLLTPVGGYPYTFTLTDGNDYPGLPAWSGRGTDWEEVVVPLPYADDEILLRFHFVSDFTGSSGIYLGWFVDELVVRSFAHSHAAVFDAPVVNDGSAQIGFSVLPLFEVTNPGAVTLVRETGRERYALGRYPYDDRIDETVEITGMVPGQVDRYWLIWDDAALEPAGPLTVSVPASPGQPLLRGTQSLVRRSESGSVRYRVPGLEPAMATVDLFDVRGRLVTRLVQAVHLPGPYEIPWPDRDETGRSLGAGVYFLKLSGAGFAETARVVLIP